MSSSPVGNALTKRRPTSLPPPPKKASKLILRESAQAVATPGTAQGKEGERERQWGRPILAAWPPRRSALPEKRRRGGGVGDRGTVPAVTDGLRHGIIQEALEVE